MSKLKTISAENLPEILWKDVRVVTTETLADGYGTDAENIRRNLNRNRSRFVEGEHVFTIEGEALKTLRGTISPAQISNKVRSLTLYTVRGAARMSKIVDTDEAWSFFEKMEHAYFRKPETDAGLALPNFDDPIAAAEAWIEAKKAERIAVGYVDRLSRYANNLQNHLAEGLTPVQFCKQLNGVNTRMVNAFLEERNWLFDDRPDNKHPRWRVKAYARDQYLRERAGKIEQEDGEMRDTFTPLLKLKGAIWIYRHYLKGEFPMKKTWDGKFTHDIDLQEALNASR